MSLFALILTHNEAHHLRRCVQSIRELVDNIIVVDSGSTDGTVELAEELGAIVYRRSWRNYADQFNWGLSQIPAHVQWVLRIDADEYLSNELAQGIPAAIAVASDDTEGFFVRRAMIFQGQKILNGGVYPILVLRIFRRGKGACENRWMDEHIKVSGKTCYINADLIDENLNSLSWWTDKHNRYASREAIDVLNREFHWFAEDSVADLAPGSQASFKRWLKERVYARLPGGWRACAYFLYRFVIRLGFLDGRAGAQFHVLQGFWYRYLVDAKISEVRRFIESSGCAPHEAAIKILGIDPRGSPAASPDSQDRPAS